MVNKYDNWLKRKKLPKAISILELSVLGRRLKIDVDAIREKHMTAEWDDLYRAVKEKLEAK